MKVGGIQGLMIKYFEAVPPRGLPAELVLSNATNSSIAYNSSSYGLMNATISTCGLPRSDAFHILRDPVSADLPWPGILVRSTFVSVWYWCADQVGGLIFANTVYNDKWTKLTV